MARRTTAETRMPGTLVISLDFELHWGVRDIYPASGAYTANLLGAREAIPRMLALFAEYEVAATWATVGFLFAESRDELETFHPTLRPNYADTGLNPYAEPVGEGEADDPLHFAPSLIRRIRETPAQEIGTHTYSHYYCLEAGSEAESFRQDLESAVAIARARGIDVQSLVLPRNQWDPRFASVLTDLGLRAYRGNQPGWMYRAERLASESYGKRAARLTDAYLPITDWSGASWHDLRHDTPPCDVSASAFLRPVSAGSRWANERRTGRITKALEHAARAGRIFHLWWHPHNFGTQTDENLQALRAVLDHYARMRGEHGMESLAMADVAERARGEALEKAGRGHG